VASTGQSKNVISFLALSRTKKPSCCVINIRRNGGRGKELQRQQIAFVRSRRFVGEGCSARCSGCRELIVLKIVLSSTRSLLVQQISEDRKTPTTRKWVFSAKLPKFTHLSFPTVFQSRGENRTLTSLVNNKIARHCALLAQLHAKQSEKREQEGRDIRKTCLTLRSRYNKQKRDAVGRE
jgi:hypothetical protein